jgi:hypothetical protein
MSAAIVPSIAALLRHHLRRWPVMAAALIAQPRAQATFEILTSQTRYAIIFRISDANCLRPAHGA